MAHPHNSANMVAERGRPRVAERIVDVLVPPIMEEIVKVVKTFLQEQISERIRTQIVDVYESPVVEQVTAVPKTSSRDRTLKCTAEQILDVLVPEMAKQLVEVRGTVSQDRIQQRIVEQIVDAPVMQAMEELAEVSMVFSQDRIQRRIVEQIIPATLLTEMIIDVPVIQTPEKTQQAMNTYVQHVVDTVEVERPKIIDGTVQKPIIQEKINPVTKHVEVSLSQFTDKAMDIPVVAQRQISRETVQKSTEIPQLRYCDQVVDVPVKLAAQVPRVLVVEKTTEILQFGAAELLKFNTSKPGDEQISLKEYVDRTKERLDLGDEDEKKTLEELNTEPKPLTKLMKHILADKVEMARVCDRIVDSPCVPTTSEYGWSAKMERIMEAQALRDNSMISHMVSKKTMEVNPAAWERQHKQQRESSKHQPTKKSTRQERGGERKEEERDQEGRKEEERKVEERGKQVEEDVTGWTEVTRKRRRKMIQIFVRVNGSKVTPMEVSLTDDRVEDVMRRIQNDEDVYVTLHGRVLKRGEKLRSCEVTDGCTIQVTSRMRGGGKYKDKKSKIEKERSGSPKKIEQAHGQKVEVQPSRNVDEMYVLMEEQMRLMREEAKGLHVTGEVMRRIVEHVVKMRLMAENMKKQASDDDLKCVEKMERGLKVFMEEVRDRQKELEMRETKEEVGRKATREGRGCAGLVQGGDETHRMNETCGKGKGKGNGGKGEHGGKGDKGGKGHEGTRKLRWADCEEEEGSETRSSRGRVA